MNMQNIKVLAEQLKAIGFDNMAYCLVKRMCLLPDIFSITEDYVDETDKVGCSFYFEKDNDTATFRLVYYDAVLKKEQALPGIEIENINIRELNERMALIDWKNAFDFTTKKPVAFDDKNIFDKETMIEQVIIDLNKLQVSEAGKNYSTLLKQSYWVQLPYQPEMGSITNGRNKTEISQRFYCSEGQPVISVQEAYRFLRNRWVEKQMQAKRKQSDTPIEEDAEETFAASGSGLLKKRRLNNNKTVKKNKVSA